ncbi:unnamed protein product [Adineta steineri]|uniref:Uncharacterized protein n=5 Tax=Adineta steineri TaxID=433720 RepID=A0A819K6D3_9BILA|nr:unnamed protein product [Adineta steineri]CAF3939196.1 unnamed protein product [Adineta steineri]
MVSLCHSPFNCYNDRKRYKTMIIFNIFELIFFIIRLSLVSNDLSQSHSSTRNFLIPILIFDLIGSVPLIICNIIYVIMRHCIQPLIHQTTSAQYLWNIGTMTCIRLDFHKDRPQAILLIRILFIICSFILIFICFVLGASCSARFQSQCTAYAVVAGFALVSSIIVIILEFVHFFRLWNYNPSDSRNTNRIYNITAPPMITKTHRRHLRFIHSSLLNVETSDNFRRSKCKQENNCKSQSLHHFLLYHSLGIQHDIDVANLNDDEKKSFIAYYETTAKEAFEIAQNGFPYGYSTGPAKDCLHLRKYIFFTRSCQSPTAEAIICVRLNLGRIIVLQTDENLNLDPYFSRADGQCDTIYILNNRRLYLRIPGQIEKWIVTIKAQVAVNDTLDRKIYQHCL